MQLGSTWEGTTETGTKCEREQRKRLKGREGEREKWDETGCWRKRKRKEEGEKEK